VRILGKITLNISIIVMYIVIVPMTMIVGIYVGVRAAFHTLIDEGGR
jgi:hypothetical protein